MLSERTVDGWQLRLKSQGGGRFLSAGFLAFWLCGWAVGEAFALWFLIQGGWAVLTGTPPEPGRDLIPVGPAVMTGLFLLFWLTLWTFGGIAALAELLRLLWGEDRFTVAAGRLTVTWQRGWFRKVRAFDRDAIRRLSLVGRSEHLGLETGGMRVELSGLGTRAERIEALAGLKAELGFQEAPDIAPVVPEAWEVIVTPEGERALVPRVATRRIQARITSGITLLFAAVTFVLARESVHQRELLVPAFIVFAFMVALAAGAMWLARGRWEWRIESQRLTLRKRYGSDVRDVFVARRLLVDHTTDSDGDDWYELLGLGEGQAPPPPTKFKWQPTRPKNSRQIARVMNDASSMRELGAWLARQTDLELDDRSTPQAREQALAELRAALENTGRFGKWAAKTVDRLSERKKDAS